MGHKDALLEYIDDLEYQLGKEKDKVSALKEALRLMLEAISSCQSALEDMAGTERLRLVEEGEEDEEG